MSNATLRQGLLCAARISSPKLYANAVPVPVWRSFPARRFQSSSSSSSDSDSDAWQAPPMLGRYSQLPVELFRINSSDQVILRDYDSQAVRGKSTYDLYLGDDGMVHPLEVPDLFERTVYDISKVGRQS
jgi:hypothetical protein